MSHNPTQDYSHKELAKILGLLTYNLLAQAKMEEAKVSRLQQESLSFRIQAEEAQRNLAQAHDQLDQVMAETRSQRETADGKDAELQEEVKGLQQALSDLRVDTARREQQEKDTSEELQQAKALLIRAETELKERVAKAKAYEGHLQSAREEINALYQERTHLKDKLDTAHRELKHAYRLQNDSEKEIPNMEFPLTSGLISPKQELTFQKGGEGPRLKTSPENHRVTAAPVPNTKLDALGDPGTDHDHHSTQKTEPTGKDLNGPKETGTRQHKHQVSTGNSKNPCSMRQINRNVDYQ
ncbi:hypothetical protein HF521_002831 [Silurus meridionalis]|uniref:Uncharacterized protein n=1 Tax=Silurus meridionalis TaxID=175797 RepID=A0A8T0B4A0_SILME|nr:hypothetical protein HF521_002831 [Silurus meridionalis]